jgi:hypothetical protein
MYIIGPGAYQSAVAQSFVKKTFNVTFMDKPIVSLSKQV